MRILLKKLRNRFIIYLSQKLDRCPGLKRRIYDLRYWMWRLLVRKRGYQKDGVSNLDMTYWVNPNRIIYALKGDFRTYRDKGKVVDGDWDLPENRIPFEELDVYQAFCQRFLNHKGWEETQFYRRVLAEISDGQIKWNCISREQLDDRCRKLDQLYQTIRDIGYKTQKELNAGSRGLFEEDEIVVSIARTGELLFSDGRHRLSIAKILGLKEVPVKVTVRHLQWVEFRNEILDYIENKLGGRGYQPLTHPDLTDIPSFYEDNRYKVIKENLSTKEGTLLDIGSYWGYFCHKFEDEGFDCLAVEHNPTNLYFLNKLKQAENRRFKVLFGSIFDYRDILDFDVVLALNIFHHFLRHKALYLKFIELLGRLETRELFLQTANVDEPMMKDAYKNPTPDELVDIILKHSCLKDAKRIGESSDRRSLYKLYKLYRS